MTAWCMQVIRASLGEQVVAKQYALPAGLDAMLLHLQLSILGKRAVVAAGGEVNALDLTKHITRTFQSQVCRHLSELRSTHCASQRPSHASSRARWPFVCQGCMQKMHTC